MNQEPCVRQPTFNDIICADQRIIRWQKIRLSLREKIKEEENGKNRRADRVILAGRDIRIF